MKSGIEHPGREGDGLADMRAGHGNGFANANWSMKLHRPYTQLHYDLLMVIFDVLNIMEVA